MDLVSLHFSSLFFNTFSTGFCLSPFIFYFFFKLFFLFFFLYLLFYYFSFVYPKYFFHYWLSTKKNDYTETISLNRISYLSITYSHTSKTTNAAFSTRTQILKFSILNTSYFLVTNELKFSGFKYWYPAKIVLYLLKNYKILIDNFYIKTVMII